ncbi:MAG: hypothetical protein HDQ88_04675 [Clostridia bacterium]|nr:hypothetical protein [Clostridia bacterium]
MSISFCGITKTDKKIILDCNTNSTTYSRNGTFKVIAPKVGSPRTLTIKQNGNSSTTPATAVLKQIIATTGTPGNTPNGSSVTSSIEYSIYNTSYNNGSINGNIIGSGSGRTVEVKTPDSTEVGVFKLNDTNRSVVSGQFKVSKLNQYNYTPVTLNISFIFDKEIKSVALKAGSPPTTIQVYPSYKTFKASLDYPKQGSTNIGIAANATYRIIFNDDTYIYLDVDFYCTL